MQIDINIMQRILTDRTWVMVELMVRLSSVVVVRLSVTDVFC